MLKSGLNVLREQSLWYNYPPPLIESGGTYARSTSPEPVIEKDIPLSRDWLPLGITPPPPPKKKKKKKSLSHAFLGNIPESTPPKYRFPKKMKTRHAAPLCIRVGGGGGGGVSVPISFLRKEIWFKYDALSH